LKITPVGSFSSAPTNQTLRVVLGGDTARARGHAPPEESLPGRVALVTGGTRGIGAAISSDLAPRGAAVAAGFSSHRERADGFLRTLPRGAGGASVDQGVWGFVAPARVAGRDLVLRPCRSGGRRHRFSDNKGDAMKTRITQPHIYGTPVVTDGRSFPSTQRELVIASLLARPDA
jgi:hypothetical protein